MNMMLNMVNVPVKEPVKGQVATNISTEKISNQNTSKVSTNSKGKDGKNFNDVLTNATNENQNVEENAVQAGTNDVLNAMATAVLNPKLTVVDNQTETSINFAEIKENALEVSNEVLDKNPNDVLGQNLANDFASKLQNMQLQQWSQKQVGDVSNTIQQPIEAAVATQEVVESILPQIDPALTKLKTDGKKDSLQAHSTDVNKSETVGKPLVSENVIPLAGENLQNTNPTKVDLLKSNQQPQENLKSNLNVLFVSDNARQKISQPLQNAEPQTTLDTSTPINQFAVMMNNRIDTNVVQQTNALSQPEETVTDYDIHTQIIDKAKLIKNNEDTQMIIKLKPEHLGDLTLKVIVEKGVVSASFHSENAQVRTMLESSLIQLKQELASQGIKVDNVSVYAGLGDLMSNGEQAQYNQQKSSKFKNQKIDLADFEEEVDKTNVPISKVTDDGVDYRI